ncbi:unnamed protein product [Ectocarpus sp. 13 AM-2016]
MRRGSTRKTRKVYVPPPLCFLGAVGAGPPRTADRSADGNSELARAMRRQSTSRYARSHVAMDESRGWVVGAMA